jgi:hypothetical protein
MKHRATKIDFRGLVEHRHEADPLLGTSGAAVVVRRGVDRSLVLACPDSCGEKLTINLDQRSGPAWRLYSDAGALSLYPSVWRHTGCRSHFIIWLSRIYWCDVDEELQATDATFEQQVLGKLSQELQPCAAVAEQLNAVPWAILSACQRLQARGLAQGGSGDQRSWFRLARR